jgi:hypothetical protein
MVLSWIRHLWRHGISSGVRLGGVGVGRRLMASVVTGTLGIDLYFSISYDFICKVFRIIILSIFIFQFPHMLLHVIFYSINEIYGSLLKKLQIFQGYALDRRIGFKEEGYNTVDTGVEAATPRCLF